MSPNLLNALVRKWDTPSPRLLTGLPIPPVALKVRLGSQMLPGV